MIEKNLAEESLGERYSGYIAFTLTNTAGPNKFCCAHQHASINPVENLLLTCSAPPVSPPVQCRCLNG